MTNSIERESVKLLPRALLVVFSLAAALVYRVSVSVVPPGLPESVVLIALAAILLAAALLARGSKELARYWEVPFAFFVFTVAGFLGDIGVSPLQHWFTLGVLAEHPGPNNPLASSVWGTVGAQLFSTVLLTLPVILLTRASGGTLKSIFFDREDNWWGIGIAVLCFALFYGLAALGLSSRFFPNNGVTPQRLLALTPALLILVLANGFREELWFRGLFLKKYGRFLAPFSSNLLAAVIFASFHVQVQYSRSLPFFLVVALGEGLLLGLLMQRSKSLLAAAILHAGTDIPIFLVYLSYASS